MKNKIIFAIIVIIIGVGAFYAGVKYGQRGFSTGGPQGFNRGDFQNLPGGAAGRFQGRTAGANFLFGEITAKDEASITVKLPAGGSRIIFYSESTEIGKFVKASAADLEIGKTISVNGKANSDGSITAQSIQVRPEGSMPRQQ